MTKPSGLRREEAVGVTAADAVWSERRGLWLRPHTLDGNVATESRRYVKLMPPRPTDTLLDIGGNIGSVASYYARAGVAWVVSVEPEPDNVAMFQLNTAAYGPRVQLIERAVVGHPLTQNDTTTLYVSEAANRGHHSTYPRDRSSRPTLQVPVVPLALLLDHYRPSLLKVDVEGAEYTFEDELAALPTFVRALTIELHLFALRKWRPWGVRLDQRIQDSGFHVTHSAGLFATSHHVLRTYER